MEHSRQEGKAAEFIWYRSLHGQGKVHPDYAGEGYEAEQTASKMLPYLQKATDPLFNASTVLSGIVGSDVQKPNGISHLKLKKQLQFAQLW